MTQNQALWNLLLRSLLISGAIALFPLPAMAQRVPIADDSLGNEGSIVSPDEVIRNRPSNRIDGGARRGANLFHSFREFNIDAGRGAYFTNPDGVAHIITRVTGGNRSDILGTLGVLGNANLFLINPNGILFGQNARLDIGGSFVSSTADSLVFDNKFAFSAVDPQAPPLLTVSAPIGLQYGRNPGEVRSEGATLRVLNGQTLTLAGGAVNIDGGQLLARGGRVELAGVAVPGVVGLRQQGQEWRLSVPEGLSRADVAIGNGAIVDVRSNGGGSIGINARNLTVAGAGTGVQAGIAANSGTVGTQAGDIDINATETVNLDASRVLNTIRPDSIGNAGNTYITTGSLVSTNGGVVTTVTAGQGNAGSITIRARDAISIDGVGGVSSQVNSVGIGQGGNISITTGALSLTNGGIVDASTRGRGSAGNITIRARDTLSFDGEGSDGFASGVYSIVDLKGIGQGGEIRITTGNLRLTDGAVVRADILGQGGAGNITIRATDLVSFDGEDSSGFPSATSSSVIPGAIGRGGDIRITTGSLRLTDGGTVNASTQGHGDAGNITIRARDAVSFNGMGSSRASTGAFSAVDAGVGQGGDIHITTGNLYLTNGGNVTVTTRGQGDAGNITIRARDAVSFDGESRNGDPSGAFSAVDIGGIGRGGNIRITTNSLSLTNEAAVSAVTLEQERAGNITFDAPTLVVAGGAQVLAATSSTGNGGSIVVNAPVSVNLRRSNNLSPVLSVETSGSGQAGDITINTPSLTLAERARITATATATATNPKGGGSVTLNASNLNLAGIVGVFAETQGQSPAGTLRLHPYRNQPDLEITLTPRSQISASTSGSGRGGDLIVTAPRSIAITGSGRLAVTTSGVGKAGNINFTTQQLSLSDGVNISASTSGAGRAGEIDIKADTFTLRGGSRVSTNTSSRGAAGDITVRANDQLFLTGRGTGLFARTASGSTGAGGSITIDPRSVQLEDGATIAVGSQGRGSGGNIILQADQLALDRRSTITAETASTQGGSITLQVPDLLLLRDRSRISTTAGTAQAGGNGGNIRFDGQFIVAPANENNDISANAFTGRGGNVEINAQSIFGIQSRPQPTLQSDITASSARGINGVVNINTPDVDPSRGLVQLPVEVTDASRLIAQTCPTGNSANQSNQFIITGRGGLPPIPSEAMNRDAIQVDLVTANAEQQPSVSHQEAKPDHSLPESPIAEAQGWQVAADGKVMLVAAVPESTIASSSNRLAHCR